MVSYLLPEDIQQKLQCGYCSNLLSVGKVTVPNYDKGLLYACGRCSKRSGSSTRASAYEAIATVVKFPCRYSEFGCNRQLGWGRVLDHEKSCEHRIYSCLAENCEWKGNVDALKVHIEGYHKNIIVKGILKVPTSDSKCLNVMFAFDELFLIKSCFLDSKFSLIVKYLGKPQDSGRFTYEVVVKQKNGRRPVSLVLYNGKVKVFTDYRNDEDDMDLVNTTTELETIFGTLNLKCVIKIIEDIPKKEKKAKEPNVDLKINENKMQQAPKETEEKGLAIAKSTPPKKVTSEKNKENINSNIQTESMAPIDKSQANKSVEANIIRELECPVCQEYIFPPIYLCTLGHSICNNCRSRLTKCPTCSSEYGNTRNYTLENMMQLINLPCRNESVGCAFIGNISSIQEHVSCCSYDNFNCPIPIECKWKGAVDQLFMHLKSYHKRNVYLKLNEAVVHNCNSDETIHNLVQLENKLFRISCKYTGKKNGLMKWSLQQVLPKVSTDWKIEIDFIDQTGQNRKFIMNHLFSDITEDKGIFHNALVIPAALLQPYLDDLKLLHFKYNIYE